MRSFSSHYSFSEHNFLQQVTLENWLPTLSQFMHKALSLPVEGVLEGGNKHTIYACITENCIIKHCTQRGLRLQTKEALFGIFIFLETLQHLKHYRSFSKWKQLKNDRVSKSCSSNRSVSVSVSLALKRNFKMLESKDGQFSWHWKPQSKSIMCMRYPSCMEK